MPVKEKLQKEKGHRKRKVTEIARHMEKTKTNFLREKKNLITLIALILAGVLFLSGAGFVIYNNSNQSDKDKDRTSSLVGGSGPGSGAGSNHDLSSGNEQEGNNLSSNQGDSVSDIISDYVSIIGGSQDNSLLSNGPGESDLSSTGSKWPASSSTGSQTPGGPSSNLPTGDLGQGKIVLWKQPPAMKANTTWTVEVRTPDSSQWHPLYVYTAKMGHQEGNDPLRALVGMDYNGPVETSLVRFDFSGTIEVRMKYNKGKLNKADLSPQSYGVQANIRDNYLSFTLTQDKNSPRKMIIRPNDLWEGEVLHLMTGLPEENVPNPKAGNVLLINPGDAIPRVLPQGKDTYYFAPGVHVLPAGVWVEYDAGSQIQVSSFDLISGGQREFLVPAGMNYRIEYKKNLNDKYMTAFEDLNNGKIDIRGKKFSPVTGRYFRLVILGNSSKSKTAGLNYLNSSHIKEFRLYESSSNKNIIKNKSIAGSSFNHRITCDDNETQNSFYGHVYGGEAFFVTDDSVTLYLAPGSVLKGALIADGNDDVKIIGRGILDCSSLVHDPAHTYREGRSSAIRAEYADNILIDGITILDAPMWGIVTNFSSNPVVRDIVFMGSIVNSDGVHMSGVSNGLFENSFVRTCDDIFVMYHYGPANNITVRNNVFFTDGGRVVLLGMDDTPGDIENITFDNNDLINVQNVYDISLHGGAFNLWASGGNAIKNIKFLNTRIEAFREPRIASVFQFKTIEFSSWGPGKIENILFENLSYLGQGEAVSFARGASGEFSIRGLEFKNVYWSGKKLSQSHHPNLEFKEFVYDVSFK